MMNIVDTEIPGSNSPPLPPGTIILEDLCGSVVLSPLPTSDPNDPLNWTNWRKAINFGLVCLYTLLVYTVLDIATVVYGPVNEELGFSFYELNLSYAACNASLGIGAVGFIAMAFKFGRRPVYILSSCIMVGCTIWQARMQSRGDLYGFNVASGLTGSISETICGMTIADLYFVHQRGTPTNLLTIAVNIGSFLSPVAAGFIADAQGWRWIWWWTSILLGATLLAFIFCYEETIFNASLEHDSSLSGNLTTVSSKDSGRNVEHSEMQVVIPVKSYRERLPLFTTTPGGFGTVLRHCYQPFVITFRYPGVLFVAIVYGSLSAWLAIVLSVQAIYFTLPPYNFSSSGVGLLNIASFVGSLLGGFFGGTLSDVHIRWLARRNNGIYEPEMRLWLTLPTLLITPAGYLMFGLSTAQGMPWAIPAMGLGIYGFGSNALTNLVLLYLIDSYKEVIGDAYVAINLFRNVFAALVTVFIIPWIDAMGFYDMFVLSGGLSIAITLLVIPMKVWGRRCRELTATHYAATASQIFGSRRTV